MDIIAAAGKASGVGRTTLIRKMIKNLGCRTGVLKTSVNEERDDYLVSDDPEVISTPGKDTALFLESGAEKVVFLTSDYNRLKESLEEALPYFNGVDYLLIEGNSILDYLNPDLIFYLTREGLDPRPSAEKAESRADIIIDNTNFEKESEITFNNSRVTCYKAHLAASALGIKKTDLGQMLDQAGVKVKACQLGLF